MMNLTPYVQLRRLSTLVAVSIVTLFTLAGLTGMLLAFNYEPTAGGAFYSLQSIVAALNNGGLFYSVHNIAGNAIIVLAMVQLLVLFLGRQFTRYWVLAWISGGLLTLNLMGLSWTSMILRWNQEGYWRLKIELGQISSIPVVGETLAQILTGGAGISTATVQHLYSIHSYALPLTALGLAVAHLVTLVLQQQADKSRVLAGLEKLVTEPNAGDAATSTDLGSAAGQVTSEVGS